jgi:hypothetical protein
MSKWITDAGKQYISWGVLLKFSCCCLKQKKPSAIVIARYSGKGLSNMKSSLCSLLLLLLIPQSSLYLARFSDLIGNYSTRLLTCHAGNVTITLYLLPTSETQVLSTAPQSFSRRDSAANRTLFFLVDSSVTTSGRSYLSIARGRLRLGHIV